MFPKIDPKKMQAMMSQMGIKQQEIDASRVIIETPEKNIIINNPSVVKINMQGQDSFQISGDISEEGNSEEETSEKPEGVLDEDNNEQDIKTIVEKTGCSEDEAKQALEDSNGDLTEAILNLS